MLLEGFIFGMFLQLTIGPVCLYVINTALTKGFLIAFFSVAGVTLADAVYIAFALFGISALSRDEKKWKIFTIAGGVVIILFGLNMIVGASGHGFIPQISWLQKFADGTGYFFFAFLLTLSNPLTIIFWSGIFAVKVSEKKDGSLPLFGLGAVLSTLVFLSGVAGLGSVFHVYMPAAAIKMLNIAAGAIIIIFGISFLNRVQKTS